MSTPTTPRRVADRLLDDDRVLLLVEGAVHHQDQPDAYERVLEARAVEPADRGHDDVIEVALAAAVPLHRVEAQLEGRDVLRAVGAADRRVHRALDRERARLDQLGPVVDLVEGVERVDAARVGDRDEPVELPVVLDRERDALLVGEAPHDLGGNRRAEVRVELGEALLEHGAESSHGRLGLRTSWSDPCGLANPSDWKYWQLRQGRTAAGSTRALGLTVGARMPRGSPAVSG